MSADIPREHPPQPKDPLNRSFQSDDELVLRLHNPIDIKFSTPPDSPILSKALFDFLLQPSEYFEVKRNLRSDRQDDLAAFIRIKKEAKKKKVNTSISFS